MNKIAEAKTKIFTRDFYQCRFPGCFVRGEQNLELAHRIAKGKGNRKYIRNKIRQWFGEDLDEAGIDKIIHHHFNLVTSCRIHNPYFNLANNKQMADQLILEIYFDLKSIDYKDPGNGYD